jgi:hypothetical protein
MRLRFGLPLMVVMWIAMMSLSYAISVSIYWPVVAVIALFCTRDSLRLGIAHYPTSFALPPLGLFVVLTVAWPIAFPWYLRVRRKVKTGELQPGTPTVGWAGYALAAAAALVAVLGMWTTKRVQSSPLIATLTTTAQSISDACYVDLNVQVRNDNTLQLILPPHFMRPKNENEAYARRLAWFARRVHPNADSLRAIDVLFLEVTRRGDVTTRRELARFGFWPRQLAVAPEGPSVEDADERFARVVAKLLIDDDPTVWQRFRRDPGSPDSTVSVDSIRTMFRPWLPPRQPDSIQRVECLSYHGLDGIRRTSLAWRVDSTRWLLDVWIRGAGSEMMFTSVNINKFGAQ